MLSRTLIADYLQDQQRLASPLRQTSLDRLDNQVAGCTMLFGRRFLRFQQADQTKREKIYSDLQDLWYKEAIAIPLYQQIDVRAYQEYVKGYVPNPMFNQEWEDLKRISKE